MSTADATRAPPLRVLFLAPTVVVGGITTWARVLRKYANHERVQYEVIDTSRLFVPPGSERRGLYYVAMASRDAMVRLFAILWAVLRRRPDLAWFTVGAGYFGIVRDALYIMILNLLRVPSIMHLHGGDVKVFFGGCAPRRWLVRRALASCRAVLVITREVERAARGIFELDRVIYVPNMIDDALVAEDIERVMRPSDAGAPVRLLHVAWQAPVKGALDLINALPHMRRTVECHFVGNVPDEYKDLYHARALELGVADRVHFVGTKRGDELVREFMEADLFVLPTHGEGFPMVILEAMAYGLPIVANEVGNIAEMIAAHTDRPAGVLLEQVEPVDPQELAAKTDALLDDAPRRRAYSENGRHRIRAQYLASKVVPELEDLLAALVRGNPTGRDRHRWGRCEEGPA